VNDSKCRAVRRKSKLLPMTALRIIGIPDTTRYGGEGLRLGPIYPTLMAASMTVREIVPSRSVQFTSVNEHKQQAVLQIEPSNHHH